jgi:hypothetical protein
VFLLHHVPQHRLRGKRRPIEEHDRSTHCKTGDQPIPHHPAASREIEDSIVPREIGVEYELLEVLQQGSAGTMHHALRKTRRPRGIEDIKRVVEIEALVRRYGGTAVRRLQPVIPFNSIHDAAGVWCATEVGYDHHTLDLGYACNYLLHTRKRVDLLPGVAVAVGTEEHPRLDLTEAIDDAIDPEVRGARGPDRTQARCGKHGDHRLRHIGKESGHAVARYDAVLP